MKLIISNGVFENEISGIKEFSIENSEMLLFFETEKSFLRASNTILELYENVQELNPDTEISELTVDEKDLIIYLDLSEINVAYNS